jgi:hypothetical protein
MAEVVGKPTRTSARHRVCLAVRYSTATEFVQEYAENLSRGGLFIADAHHLQPLADVAVEIDLPGSGTYQVKGVVAHILDVDLAAKMGRKPGAGIEIRTVPVGFNDALESYLHRLGRRADVTVFVADARCAAALARAGYGVAPAPAPESFAAEFVRADSEVIAVVVPRSSELAYQQAAAAAGGGDMVVCMDSPAQLDEILRRLDDEL